MFRDFFSPSKDSTTAVPGTPLTGKKERPRRKSKKVVIEFPTEWQTSNGNGDDIVGEPFHSIWDDHPEFRRYRRHRFWGPFVLGAAVAFVLIAMPSMAGIYWTCQNVPAMPISPSCPTREEGMQKRKILQLPRWFQKQPPKEDESPTLDGSTNLPISQYTDPTTCACQLLWKYLEPFQRLGGWRHRSTSNSECRVVSLVNGDETALKSASKSKLQNKIKDNEMRAQFKKAFTDPYIELTPKKSRLITSFSKQLRALIPDFEERVRLVPWGGRRNGPSWYPSRISSSTTNGKKTTELEALDGGILAYGYLRVMDWPEKLVSHFPKKLCPSGCAAEESFRHTLEWREKYKPWIINPAMKDENANGAVYHHGFSPPLNDDPKNEGARHAIVWARPGYRNKLSDTMYVRLFMNAVDRSVAASMEKSNGRVGKFNFVLDATKFQMSALPSIHYIKMFVTMLGEHYPDRLGMILMMNMSYVAELGTKLFLPLLSKEVRDKLKVVPHDPIKRQQLLETVLGAENVPVSLGGTDTYEFQVDEYYSELEKELSATDEQALEYLTTMPYHA